MRWLGALAALPLLLSVALPRPASGQDLELESSRTGKALPAGYFALRARAPDAFTLSRPWRRSTGKPAQVAGVTVLNGTLPVLVVPGRFANSIQPVASRTQLQQHYFDGPTLRGRGTLAAFYSEISVNQLDLAGAVGPWLQTGMTITQASGGASCLGLCDDAKVGEWLVEVLRAHDTLVDFGRFDNDGPDGIPNSGDDDGFVDATAFVFPDPNGACGGSSAIWAHRWRVSGWLGEPYASRDAQPDGSPILVDDYIIQSIADCAGQISTVAVLAHEFGHIIGLPDLYHPEPGEPTASKRRWVVGCFGLMAAGSGWGCGAGGVATFGPSHMTPWSKDQLGWQNYIEVDRHTVNQLYVLPAAQGSNQALKIPMDDEGREFMVVEYRPAESFDATLPASGVLVYHLDETGTNHPDLASGELYRFKLIEADGRLDLLTSTLNGGNRGEAADMYQTGAFMDATTAPASLRSDGTPSTVTIHSVTVGFGAAEVRVTADPNPTLLGVDSLPATTALSSYALNAQVVGGAKPYTITPGPTTHGLNVGSSEDLITISGRPDISGAIEVTATVVDALGTSADFAIEIQVGDPNFPDVLLAQNIFGVSPQPLSETEKAFLDRTGNRSERFDIGDVRAYLLRR